MRRKKKYGSADIAEVTVDRRDTIGYELRDDLATCFTRNFRLSVDHEYRRGGKLAE